MLKIRNLKTSFDVKGFPALMGINLELKKNELVTLLGPSGGGKTTLLKSIAGIAKVSFGIIENHFKKISFVSNMEIFKTLKVYEALDSACEIEDLGDRHHLIHSTLEEMELLSKDNRLIETLSAGEFLRFLLAYHLVKEADLILLDEPFAAFDRCLRELLAKKLKEIVRSRNVTIFMSSHHIPEAMSSSDRVGVLIDGVIKALGKPLDIWQRPPSFHVAEFLYPINLFQLKFNQKKFVNHVIKINPKEIGNVLSDIDDENEAYILGVRYYSFKLHKELGTDIYEGELLEKFSDGDNLFIKVRGVEKNLVMSFSISDITYVEEFIRNKNMYFSFKLNEAFLWKL